MKLFRSENEKKAVLKAAEKRIRAKMDDAAHRFQPGKRVMFEVRKLFSKNKRNTIIFHTTRKAKTVLDGI